jgi:hypothetical protein
MKENDSSIDNAKTIGIPDPPEMCDRSLASAHAREGDGVERENHIDRKTIIPLEAKPIIPRRRITDSKAIIGTKAMVDKPDSNGLCKVTQAPLLPAHRYTLEERILIRGLREYDNADRRFLSKGAMWNMADRKPEKNSVPVKENDLNTGEGIASCDCFSYWDYRHAWADYLNSFPWDIFLTLTSEEPIHPESLDKLSNQIVHRINRKVYGQRYYKRPHTGVLVAKAVEMQKRDVLHSHMLIAGVPESFYRKDLWEYIWKKKGCVNRIEPYDKRLGAGHYLSKYVSKEANIEMYGNTSLLTHGFIPQRLAGL